MEEGEQDKVAGAIKTEKKKSTKKAHYYIADQPHSPSGGYFCPRWWSGCRNKEGLADRVSALVLVQCPLL